MASTSLTNKFIKGLKEYNLTPDDINDNGWEYCGGRTGRHLNYFKLKCPDDDLPDRINKCVCGHNIVENCYITDGEEILILGNCCIKKFVKKVQEHVMIVEILIKIEQLINVINVEKVCVKIAAENVIVTNIKNVTRVILNKLLLKRVI